MGGLGAAEETLERYRELLTEGPSAGGPRPDTAAVPAIVKETESAQAAPKRTLWERFKDWVRSLIDRPDARRSDNWLTKWLDEHVPGQKLVEGILYVLLAALIAGIGWIVYTELRAAGLLDRWRRRQGVRAAAAAAPAAAETADARRRERCRGALDSRLRCWSGNCAGSAACRTARA